MFRGDVENYIERLRAFSHGTVAVEFDDGVRPAMAATNVLNYSPPRNWRWLTTFLSETSAGILSAIIAVMLVLAMPVINPPDWSFEMRVAFTIVVLLFPGLWLLWQSVAKWAQRDR
jgi:hypothetical protein